MEKFRKVKGQRLERSPTCILKSPRVKSCRESDFEPRAKIVKK